MAVGHPDHHLASSPELTQPGSGQTLSISENSDTLTVDETGTISQGTIAGNRIILQQVFISATKSGIMKTEIVAGGTTFVFHWDQQLKITFTQGAAIRGSNGGSIQIKTTNTTAETIGIETTHVTYLEAV